MCLAMSLSSDAVALVFKGPVLFFKMESSTPQEIQPSGGRRWRIENQISAADRTGT
jgi:hypothetical protein